MTIGRVLIVEDEAESGEALEEALTDAGFEVVLTPSSFLALDVIERWQPNVALVDIGLPGFDGYQLTEALRTRPGGEQLWILAVTARTGGTDRQKALECGMDMFLTKPVDLDDLSSTLASLLDQRRDPLDAASVTAAEADVPAEVARGGTGGT